MNRVEEPPTVVAVDTVKGEKFRVQGGRRRPICRSFVQSRGCLCVSPKLTKDSVGIDSHWGLKVPLGVLDLGSIGADVDGSVTKDGGGSVEGPFEGSAS